MGKDIQGVMRGKCNACSECEEYLAPVKDANSVLAVTTATTPRQNT